MIFTGEFNGMEIQFNTYDDTYRCGLFDGSYKSFDKICEAIKKVQAAERKDFTNKTAFMVDRWKTLEEAITSVEVLSVIDSRYVWVKKPSGGRSKESLSSLYSDRSEVEAALLTDRKADAERKAMWDAVTRWSPQVKEARP